MVGRLNLLVCTLLLVGYGSCGPFSTTYNEDVARELFNFDGAVFAPDPTACLNRTTNPEDGWELQLAKVVRCTLTEDEHECAFMILKSDVKKQILVAFRGTVGEKQFWAEALVTDRKPLGTLGDVHVYFRNAFLSVWFYVSAALANPSTSDYDVIFTGYSLGGALASISALKTVVDGHRTAEQIYVLTFGEPRTGDYTFASNVDTQLKYVHRVVNKADLVPHFPMCVGLGSRCAKLGYYHHQTEIWYPDGMDAGASYIITKTNEDTKGSNSLKKHKVADHLAYFGKNLEEWAATDCA